MPCAKSLFTFASREQIKSTTHWLMWFLLQFLGNDGTKTLFLARKKKKLSNSKSTKKSLKSCLHGCHHYKESMGGIYQTIGTMDWGSIGFKNQNRHNIQGGLGKKVR